MRGVAVWSGLCCVLCCVLGASAQVFTVGEKTATADIKTEFKPTRVELPDSAMTERGRRDLVRNLEAEQGFAHRVLPLGSILTLQANGGLMPGAEGYKEMVYKKGEAAAPGDRVAVTGLQVKGDRILIDLNGGPYAKHRFLRHLSLGVGSLDSTPANQGDPATGCRIALVFEGGVPEVSAPEVKALLEPLIDFGVKTGEQAYADTLPAPVRSAIASHELLVGMNRRMVLAAMGQPESKVRESSPTGDYEDWIYGHQPQTIRFVRFMGDRVSLIKVAALGQPIQVRDKDEMAGYLPPATERVVSVTSGPARADAAGGDQDRQAAVPPSLKRPGEKADPAPAAGGKEHKVQFPAEHKAPAAPGSAPQDLLEAPGGRPAGA